MATRYQRCNQKSYYTFGILWSLCCLSFFDLRLLITPLVSCGHCVVCPSLIYDFWLPLWYLVAIVLSVLLWSTTSDYTFGILWPLCCLSFFDLRLLITSLVSCGHCVKKDRQHNGHKIPKRQSEVVNQRRTDNTMATRYQRGNQKS
jgi:hypothetical protein